MSLVRLDHIIYEVPDIREAHAELTRKFPEAWPIGRFWPGALTSGVAIGGLNLELIQALDEPVQAPVCRTLAFEPSSADEALAAFEKAGLRAQVAEKIEGDPPLLRARGFSSEAAETPQVICNNVYSDAVEHGPFEFFACDYSPFLRTWLSPENPRLKTPAQVSQLVYGTPWPDAAASLLQRFDYRGAIVISFVAHDEMRLLRMETTAGPFPWPA